MPDIVKVPMVTPIYKGEVTNDPGKYGPISILPKLGKAIGFFENNQLT